MKKISDLKITFLGITPEYKKGKEIIPSQEIVSFSAWSSFKGKPFQKLLKEIKKKDQDPSRKTEVILKNSSLKGHSSIATTPVFSFSYEASKFLDSSLTGITFASALMASGRRTSTKESDIIVPDKFFRKKRIRKKYLQASQENIKFFNYLLSRGIPKDEASKILQYGIYGTGIIQFPVESIVSLEREFNLEKKWMPKEIEIVLEKMRKYFRKVGLDLIYASRIAAPRNAYFYPNIFKNPQKENLARIFAKNLNKDKLFDVSYFYAQIPRELKKKLIFLKKEIKRVARERKIEKKWKRLIEFRREVIRDFNLAVRVDIVSRVSWRVWGEKKRHRTVPQIVDSIYYSIGQSERKLRKYEKKIRKERLSEDDLKEIKFFVEIPFKISQEKELLYGFLRRVLESLKVYSFLIEEGADFSDAIFVVPRCIKINVLQSFDLYNLIAGYYPLRLCATVEEELRELTIKEVSLLKRILRKKKMEFLADCIVPKCHTIGFCPEKEFCNVIKTITPYYNSQAHQYFQEKLNEDFQKLKED